MNAFILFLLAVFMVACGKQNQVQSRAYGWFLGGLLSHDVNEISVDSLRRVKDRVQLLDARTPEEYKVSHIAGARLVGYKDFDSTRVAGINRVQPVVVYCAVGYRSEKIAEKLKALHFTHVTNLYGGIFEWKNRGYEVVNANGPTKKVHAYSRVWGIWLKKGNKVYAP